MAAHKPFLSSAVLIAVCTLGSRITGLARDMLLVQAFGLSWVQDAFQYAFQIPNLFRRLFGEGALAAVFVPGFTRTIENQGREAAWKMLARILAVLSVTLIVVVLLIEVIVLVLYLRTDAGDLGDTRRLLLSLTALMLPFMLAICVLALLASVLNTVGSFVAPALMPIVLNVAMIAGIIFLAPAFSPRAEEQIYAVALSVLVAGFLQWLLLWPVLRQRGVQLGWEWKHSDPQVKAVLILMGPVLLGQGVLALGTFLDSQLCTLLTHVKGTPEQANWFGLLSFTYPLQEGALSAVTVASRLYQFPLGVLTISIATAALPALSRHAARESWSDWHADLQRALRTAIFVGIWTGTALVLFPDVLVRLLFEYGRITPEDTARAARVMLGFGLGLMAYSAQHIVVRAFFSIGDVKTPLKISTALLPVNLILSTILLWQPGIREAGFAYSSAITATLAASAGLLLLQRQRGVTILSLQFFSAIGRMLLAALFAGGLTYGFDAWVLSVHVLANEDNLGIPGRILQATLLLSTLTLAFFAIAWMLRLTEVTSVLHRFARLLQPKTH
jgi:putative peptidoglycan lipid II flippase